MQTQVAVHLLVVEDEKRLRDILARFLRKQGHAVETASSGEEALQHITQQRPSLVLLDIHMAGMSGLDVLRELRGQYSSFELPVMIMSGDR